MKSPYFWSGSIDPQSREAAPLTRAMLTPLAWAYAAVTACRIRRTEPVVLGIPVICVGNLTVGGSGKTPVAAAIRDRLTTRGVRASTLSRGHGGTSAGPIKVDPTAHTARDVGDEPLMLALTGDAWISRDRPAGGRAMSKSGLDIIVLDDGHQNPTLKKDLSLVVIDTDDPVGNGYVVPKGPLREPVATGLARADAIVLTGSAETPSWLANPPIPVLRSRLQSRSPIPTRPIVAFAGIGRPEKFFGSLEKDNVDLKDTIGFPDHHPYSPKDIANLKALAAEHGAQLVTTEKDFVRLSQEERIGIYVIRVCAQFENELELDALLEPLLLRSSA